MSIQLIVLLVFVTVIGLAIGFVIGKVSKETPKKAPEMDIEKLSSIQHAIWSHWMKYQFSIATLQKGGHVVIRKSLVDRWKKQMNTEYKDLNEKEKQSDRDIVLKFMKDA